MLVVCIAKKDVDLYQTLSDSETSRHILRFYHPRKTAWGITIEVSTVSSSLSLLSELRWYIMRYMAEVLIEDVEHDVYLTRELARRVYEERSVVLSAGWNLSFKVCVTEDGGCMRVPNAISNPEKTIQVFKVWGSEEEHP
ncbi:MAG: DUF5804 family protein [Methanocorpusculum sp.]|nr:DUF5804 family protein [Methanocorpusculum sp.]